MRNEERQGNGVGKTPEAKGGGDQGGKIKLKKKFLLTMKIFWKKIVRQ